MVTTKPITSVISRWSQTPAKQRLGRLAILAGILTVSCLLMWWLFHQKGPAVTEQAIPVAVTTVTQQSVPLVLKSIGTVTPINSVAVKSHVAGQILETKFKEGQLVTAGQPLFTIDPRPLQDALGQAKADVLSKQAIVAQARAAIVKDQASVVQAQADKARDAATANNATVDAKRYSNLGKQGAVTTEQAQQMQSTATSARATVAADQAAIGSSQATTNADRATLLGAQAEVSASQAAQQDAEVQLSYTQVSAPISGLAGNIQVLNGNLVRQDTDTLVTINQIAPIYVSLTVPQQQFRQVQTYASAGPIAAEAYAETGGLLAKNGKLVFENNTVDTTTGTVLLKALFDNTTQKLWPGQFVNVVLTLAVTQNAFVVPDRAVQTGQNGSYVWVIKPDNTAVMQIVTTAQSVNGFTVIPTGLTANTTVVTDGQLQLRTGAKVSLSPLKGL
jgi:membrane fusion protein, multidrug efflux system